MLKAPQFFRKTKYLVVIGLLIIITSFAFSLASNQYTLVGLNSSETPAIVNKTKLLESLFESYKDEYVDPEFHRTIDKQRDGITTSEGQSYTMLRSVWIDDKETFDLSWEWTRNNLQREDKLFSWLWGLKEDGTWGLLDDRGGENVATDADIDIALSLIFAANKWDDNNYLDQAKEIIDSIWEKTVVKINGNYLLLPNDLEKFSEKSYYLINPSYFSPAHFRIFAKYDLNNNWNRLANDSYKYLKAFQELPISSTDNPSLPPNWIIMEKETLELRKSAISDLNTNYGYDALRIPFRVGLDWKWFRTIESKEYLNKFTALSDTLEESNQIFAEYSRDGTPIVNYETKSMYGASIPMLKITNNDSLEDVVNDNILEGFDFDKYDWENQISYYDDNWSWFGLAFYLDRTDNIQ